MIIALRVNGGCLHVYIVVHECWDASDDGDNHSSINYNHVLIQILNISPREPYVVQGICFTHHVPLWASRDMFWAITSLDRLDAFPEILPYF